MTFDEWFADAIWGNEDFKDSLRRSWEAARADERAACAKVCEDMIADQPTETTDRYDAGQITAWMIASEAIQARNTLEEGDL